MNDPTDRRYTKEHEWIKVEGDIARVGITDFAQHALSDVVYAELPAVGKKVEQFKPSATVESVKSVSDIFAPASGEIVEVNTALAEHPELINADPYGEGWIYRMKIASAEQISALMTSEEYQAMTQEKRH